jgi:hypothetical protein
MTYLRGVFKLMATVMALCLGVFVLGLYITQSAALEVYDVSCNQDCQAMAIKFAREHQSSLSDGSVFRFDGGGWTKPVSESGQAFTQVYVSEKDVIGLLANNIVSLYPKTNEYEVLFQGSLQILHPVRHDDWLVFAQYSEPFTEGENTNPPLYLFAHNLRTLKTERLLTGVNSFEFRRANFSDSGALTISTGYLLADGYSSYDPINVNAENILRGSHVFQFQSIASMLGHFSPQDLVPHQVQKGNAPISLNRSTADGSTNNIIAFSYSPIWSWVHLDLAKMALRYLPFKKSGAAVVLLPGEKKYVAVDGKSRNTIQIGLHDLATDESVRVEIFDIRKTQQVTYREKM